MANAGEIIENPASGETIEFLEVAADTDGEALRWIHSLRPGASIPTEHYHELQEERFEIAAGAVTFTIDGTDIVATEGDRLAARPGQVHTFRNDTDERVSVRIEMRPARDTETLFETTFALAREGKADERGLPNPLWSALIASETNTRDWMPRIPVAVQKAGIAVLSRIARLVGYRTADLA